MTIRQLALLIAASLAVLAVAPLVGITWISPTAYLEAAERSTNFDARVLWEMRIPRTVAAFLVGALLAIGGVVFQALFRNPLASPFTLGVSSGAALGMALATVGGLPMAIGMFSAQAGGAFLGAVLSVVAVLGIGTLAGGVSSGGASQSGVLLLAGVALSYLLSSIVLLLQYVSDLTQLFRTSRWLIGSLAGFSYSEIAILAAAGTVMVAVVMCYSDELDLLASGEEFAAGRGVAVRRVQWILVLCVSLSIAVVVTLCGVIGFVGLMVPHLCRRRIALAHRPLTVASALVGGIFLTSADAVSRALMPPYEIPVSILTAILGGPFFLFILIRSVRGYGEQGW